MRVRTGTQLRIFYVGITILLCVQGYQIYNTNHQAFLACKRVQNLQEYATLTIKRSEKTLPTITYYKNPDHKRELEIQLANLKASEKDFTPIPCHRNVFGA